MFWPARRVSRTLPDITNRQPTSSIVQAVVVTEEYVAVVRRPRRVEAAAGDGLRARVVAAIEARVDRRRAAVNR